MFMKFELVNPLDNRDWDELILSFKDYTFFHSSAWARVLVDTYNLKPLYWKITEKDTVIASLPSMEIKGLLFMHKCVSLPFSDYCGTLIYDNKLSSEVSVKIIEELKPYSFKYIEFRGGGNSKGPITVSKNYYHHNLKLHDEEGTLFKSFRNSTRRNIKKAQDKGVRVIISHSSEALDAFYKLHCKTRKHHGLPIQPKSFFNNIYKHIISAKSGFIVLAFIGETVVAGGVFFHIGEKAIFKFGASDQKYHYLKVNNAVMWEAIKYLSCNGFRILSFGRTHPENKGLLQYKDGWGTEKSVINYYYYDCLHESFKNKHCVLSPWYTTIFYKTPIPLLKVIGSILYKFQA